MTDAEIGYILVPGIVYVVFAVWMILDALIIEKETTWRFFGSLLAVMWPAVACIAVVCLLLGCFVLTINALMWLWQTAEHTQAHNDKKSAYPTP